MPLRNTIALCCIAIMLADLRHSPDLARSGLRHVMIHF
jgi:hypothetical protein